MSKQATIDFLSYKDGKKLYFAQVWTSKSSFAHTGSRVECERFILKTCRACMLDEHELKLNIYPS